MSRSIYRTIALAVVLAVYFFAEITLAKPYTTTTRRYKRMSDQRLAELETLLSLAKLKGRIVQMPIAFGKVDPARLGRKRRSNMKMYQMNKDTAESQKNHEDNYDLNLRDHEYQRNYPYQSINVSDKEGTDDRGDAAELNYSPYY